VPNKKKSLLSLLALIIISTVAVAASFANFTATPVVVPTNAFATGTLSLTADKSSVISSISNASIGDSTTGGITITNTGSLPATLSFSGTLDSGSDAALAAQLNLKIYLGTDASGTIVYDGSLSADPIDTPDQTLAAGASQSYWFVVSLPTSGSGATDNLVQGKSAVSTFTWNATAA
jgi:hypothetical protein